LTFYNNFGKVLVLRMRELNNKFNPDEEIGSTYTSTLHLQAGKVNLDWADVCAETPTPSTKKAFKDAWDNTMILHSLSRWEKALLTTNYPNAQKYLSGEIDKETFWDLKAKLISVGNIHWSSPNKDHLIGQVKELWDWKYEFNVNQLGKLKFANA
jgi:hypothetical protein